MNLFMDLQKEYGLVIILLIAQRLLCPLYVGIQMGVLHLGKIPETADTDDLV